MKRFWNDLLDCVFVAYDIKIIYIIIWDPIVIYFVISSRTVRNNNAAGSRCVLERISVTGQLLLSERFSWKIGALETPRGGRGRVNNNKISNYLARTNYWLDVRLGFPDYVTAYAPHNVQGRLKTFFVFFFFYCAPCYQQQ